MTQAQRRRHPAPPINARKPQSARDAPVPAPVAGLWALVLSGPVLLVVAGVGVLAGLPVLHAVVVGLVGQGLFVLAVICISARNRTLNSRDATAYWGSAAPDLYAAGPPHPYLQHVRVPDREVAHPQEDPPDLAPQWWVFPARRMAPAPEARLPAAACIARPSEQSRLLCEWLADMGHDAHHCADLEAMLGAVQDMPGRWGLVIVDLDHLGSLEEAIDDMIAFRESSPGVPVILISAGVARDDLSAERLNIADATLRKPVFARSFAGSLATVLENNEIWRIRRDARP